MKFIIVFLFLISCRSARIPSPQVNSCIILDRDECSCSDGENQWVQSCYGYLATSPEEYNTLKDHLDSITARLEICLVNAKKCR